MNALLIAVVADPTPGPSVQGGAPPSGVASSARLDYDLRAQLRRAFVDAYDPRLGAGGESTRILTASASSRPSRSRGRRRTCRADGGHHPVGGACAHRSGVGWRVPVFGRGLATSPLREDRLRSRQMRCVPAPWRRRAARSQERTRRASHPRFSARLPRRARWRLLRKPGRRCGARRRELRLLCARRCGAAHGGCPGSTATASRASRDGWLKRLVTAGACLGDSGAVAQAEAAGELGDPRTCAAPRRLSPRRQRCWRSLPGRHSSPWARPSCAWSS